MAAVKRFSLLSLLVLFSLICSTCTAREALYSGQRLATGQSLVQGIYVLTMQTDCNLVLYSRATPIWASATFRKGVNCYALLQFDGRFVVYSGAGKALWASGIALGTGNYILSLQPDRNLVIYGPARWATRTNVATAGFGELAIDAPAKDVGVQGDKP